jgi:uncharacterized protein Usg
MLVLVTLEVVYYRPDFRSILQEFVWQTEDQVPGIPRVHRFLDHWRREIDAVIREARLSVGDRSDWRNVDFMP